MTPYRGTQSICTDIDSALYSPTYSELNISDVANRVLSVREDNVFRRISKLFTASC